MSQPQLTSFQSPEKEGIHLDHGQTRRGINRCPCGASQGQFKHLEAFSSEHTVAPRCGRPVHDNPSECRTQGRSPPTCAGKAETFSAHLMQTKSTANDKSSPTARLAAVELFGFHRPVLSTCNADSSQSDPSGGDLTGPHLEEQEHAAQTYFTVERVTVNILLRRVTGTERLTMLLTNPCSSLLRMETSVACSIQQRSKAVWKSTMSVSL